MKTEMEIRREMARIEKLIDNTELISAQMMHQIRVNQMKWVLGEPE